MYEDNDDLDGILNIFNVNRFFIIEFVYGGFYYNIEKGDIMEEIVDV